MDVLELLRKHGTLSTSKVTELLDISPQLALRKLKALEQRGLIKRIGGSRGRGKSALWMFIGQEKHDWREKIVYAVGKAMGWINNREERGRWPFLGLKVSPTATTLAQILNLLLEGRKLEPFITKEEPIKEVLPAKEAETEYRVLLAYYLYLTNDPRLQKVLKKVEKDVDTLVKGETDVDWIVFTSFVLFFVKPLSHLIATNSLEKLLQRLRRDPLEMDFEYHRSYSLAWVAATLLEYGYIKEAKLILKELLLRVKKEESGIYLVDRPPLYLEKLYGLEKDSLDPTVILFYLLKKLGYHRKAELALNHVLKHQTPSGGFTPSPSIEPDVVRTGIVTYFLWRAIN